MNILFFGVLVLYFVATLLQFVAAIFKKEKLDRLSWIVFVIGLLGHSIYIVARGVVAGRLPLSNQFEFATAFAWGIALMLLVVRIKMNAVWLTVLAMPMAFLVLSYAALQPKEITELMPALRSAWFGLHIGSAVFSYSAFVLAGCIGLRFLIFKKRENDEFKIQQMDFMCYRLVALGFLLLTVVILSGAIWAEQAWSAFWTWDPKEVWALITWIIYAVYLHLRLRKKGSNTFMAWFVVLAVPVVLFTFAGVNTLMSGLHSYG